MVTSVPEFKVPLNEIPREQLASSVERTAHPDRAITTNRNNYSFERGNDGSFNVKIAIYTKDGQIGTGKAELVPAGTSPDATLQMLHDKLGVSKDEAQALVLNSPRELGSKASLQELAAGPKQKIAEDVKAELQAAAAKAVQAAKAQPEGAGAHVVLKPGDSLAALHATIPKDQRPSLPEFTQAFLKANPKVDNPNMVIAGKDYALPDKYNYEELRMAGRLIDSNIANLARKAVTSDSIVASSESQSQSVAMASGHDNSPTRSGR